MDDKEVVYNPYNNRNEGSPMSNFGAFVSLLSCVVGVGVLALPLGFFFAGILNGLFLLIVLALLLIHGMHVLIHSMVECSRRMEIGYANYKESVVYAFKQGPGCFRGCANAAGCFVDLVLCLSHYSMCVVYLIFVSVGFKYILDQYTVALDLRIYVTICGLLSIPTFLIRKLTSLVSVNLLSNVLSYFGFLFMFYFLFRGLSPITDRRFLLGDVQKAALFLGIVLFSISSVGVMLAIESKMETPQDLIGCCGMLNMSILVVLISYTVFGIFGYWRFGDKVASSISLNLPKREIVAMVSSIMINLAVFLTYPLSGYVVIDIIMNHYWNKSGELNGAKLKEFIVRIVFVLLTTLNALLPFNLFPLISLVGAFSISLLNLIFPALMEICLYYPPEYRKDRPKWKLWKNIFLISLGTVIFILGTYIAIKEIMETWGKSNAGTYDQ
ncbi:glutamate transporter polyphemus-like [Drosophila kikkawai]|uniref:Glutamate transporter polyphemus-like n=1 Tax=Drosophila kikkawai TaxID=30033 RepID=A0A6P4HYD3_DROKI|nr:glutamate transporter polyphemus-like [Drosophila kikkawai]